MNIDDIINSLNTYSKVDFSRLYDAENSKEDKDFKQKNGFTCGPAALSYAMHLMGVEVPQEKVADEANTTRKYGTEGKDMIDAARRFGFNTILLKNNDPDKMLDLLNKNVLDGNAVIIDYLMGNDINEDGHYAVFLGSTGDKVIIWNPALGKEQALDREYFINHWKDTELATGKGGIVKNWTLILSRS